MLSRSVQEFLYHEVCNKGTYFTLALGLPRIGLIPIDIRLTLMYNGCITFCKLNVCIHSLVFSFEPLEHYVACLTSVKASYFVS